MLETKKLWIVLLNSPIEVTPLIEQLVSADSLRGASPQALLLPNFEPLSFSGWKKAWRKVLEYD